MGRPKQSRKHKRDPTPEDIHSNADATVDGSVGTSSPASKKRKSTAVAQIQPVEIKSNMADTPSFIRFGKLPPSADTETQLNGLINNVPVASLVNPTIAQLFEHVTVYSTLSNDNLIILGQTRIHRCSYNFLVECLCEPTWSSENGSWPVIVATYFQCSVFFVLHGGHDILTIRISRLSILKSRISLLKKRLSSWMGFSNLRLESRIWKCMIPLGPCFILLLDLF